MTTFDAAPMTSVPREMPVTVRTEGVTPRYRVTHGWSGYTDHETLVEAVEHMARLLRQHATSSLVSQVGLIDLEVTTTGTYPYHPTLVEAERPVLAGAR